MFFAAPSSDKHACAPFKQKEIFVWDGILMEVTSMTRTTAHLQNLDTKSI